MGGVPAKLEFEIAEEDGVDGGEEEMELLLVLLLLLDANVEELCERFKILCKLLLNASWRMLLGEAKCRCNVVVLLRRLLLLLLLLQLLLLLPLLLLLLLALTLAAPLSKFR